MKFIALFVLVACSSHKDFPQQTPPDAKAILDAHVDAFVPDARAPDAHVYMDAQVFMRRCSTVDVESNLLVGGFECATPADAVAATAVLSYFDTNNMEQNPTLAFTISCGAPGMTANQLLPTQTFPNEKLKKVITNEFLAVCE